MSSLHEMFSGLDSFFGDSTVAAGSDAADQHVRDQLSAIDPGLFSKFLESDDELEGGEAAAASDSEDEDEEIIPPRVHRRGAQQLLFHSPAVSVVLVQWGPSQETQIHRHPCAHRDHAAAWTYVLRGAIEVSHYGSGEAPEKIGVPHLVTQELGPVCNLEGGMRGDVWHKVRNVSARNTAAVLHIYTPLSLDTCFGCTDRRAELKLAPVGDIDDLVGTLNGVIRNHRESTARTVALVQNYLSHVHIDEGECGRFYTVSADRYTRNLVCHNDNFTMLILCWSGGQASPIHDHGGSSCFVKVLQGQLEETRYVYPPEAPQGGNADLSLYNNPEKPLEEISRVTYKPRGVTYINDSLGLHKMANPSPTELCTTLHVYSPPYPQTKIFNVNTSQYNIVPMVVTSRTVPFKNQ